MISVEGCNIIPRHAEMLKVQCGYAFSDLAPDNKYAQIPEVEGLARPGKSALKIWQELSKARLEEIIEGINFQLEATGLLNKLGAGIVISGGGARMREIDKLVSYLTGLDVRFGKPIVPMKEQLFLDKLITPESATLMGLLINGLYQARSQKYPPGMVVSNEVHEESRMKTQARPTDIRIKGDGFRFIWKG